MPAENIFFGVDAHGRVTGPRGKLHKVQRVADGLVFERSSVDARGMAATGAFVHVAADVPSIHDRLHLLPNEQLAALAVAANIPRGPASERDWLLDRLTRAVETGAATLPE